MHIIDQTLEEDKPPSYNSLDSQLKQAPASTPHLYESIDGAQPTREHTIQEMFDPLCTVDQTIIPPSYNAPTRPPQNNFTYMPVDPSPQHTYMPVPQPRHNGTYAQIDQSLTPTNQPVAPMNGAAGDELLSLKYIKQELDSIPGRLQFTSRFSTGMTMLYIYVEHVAQFLPEAIKIIAKRSLIGSMCSLCFKMYL